MATAAQDNTDLHPARRHTALIDGSVMSFIDIGAGHAVLLGHSYLWDADMWRQQIAALSSRYRVIVPDLWGHGGSGRLPAGTRDLAGLAGHHLELMNHLGIENFAAIGLSVGGMWAAELARHAPHRVTALALLDTDLGAEPEPARLRYFAMLDAIVANGSVPPAVLDAVVPMFFAPDIAMRQPELPVRFRTALQDWRGDRLLDSVVPLGRMIFGRRDGLAPPPHFAMPSVVLHGTQDIPRPLAEGEHMAAALGCPFISLPGAGHISALEAPEAVTEHLLSFLSRHLRAGG